MARRLTKAFYARDTLVVARELIGKRLVHQTAEGRISGRIVETEAYHGPDDQASHARRGPTPRAVIMFGPPGVAYVYLIYGMHHCLNVVTGAEGFPSAVLIRGLDELRGIEGNAMGPGRLTKVFGIRTETHNGRSLIARGTELFVEDADESPTIVSTPRIGVDYAGEWARKKWRFVTR